MNQPKGKIEELESLRGIAALLVVIFHIPRWNPLLQTNFILNGYLMVDLFFVLSGFVIYNAYSEKIRTAKDLARFQFLRFGRLYPVHLLFLLSYLGIEFLKYFAQMRYGIVSPNSAPFRENNVTAFFEHLFLVQAIGPTGNVTTFNAPSWSISVEFYTYMLFGLTLLFIPRFKNLFFLFSFLICSFCLFNAVAVSFQSVERCVAGFTLGCLTAFLKNKYPAPFTSMWSILSFLSICIFLYYKTDTRYDLVIYGLTACLIFTLVGMKSGLIKSLLNLKPLIWLGTVSYSMYMCHWLVDWTATQVLRVILKKPEILVEGKSTLQLSNSEAFLADAAVLSAVLILAYIVFKLIEQPFRIRSRQFIS